MTSKVDKLAIFIEICKRLVELLILQEERFFFK